MSRYTILVLLNLPFIIAGILNSVVAFKMKRIGRRRLVLSLAFWLGILAGLVFTEPIYRFLFSNQLTQTEPLSLFDVVQITGVVVAFFIASRAHGRAELLERRVQDLHQELSIRLSETPKKEGHGKN